MQKELKSAYGDKVSLVEASLRWLVHHSQLKGKDAVILGPSTENHFSQNLKAMKEGPLAENVVKAFENGSMLTKADWEAYHR